MSDGPMSRLSGGQVLALKFAAHRQLTRWSNRPKLSPDQHAQRAELTRAVRILQDHTELRHRWLVAEHRCSGLGWCIHDGDHATLHDARAYVEASSRLQAVGERVCT